MNTNAEVSELTLHAAELKRAAMVYRAVNNPLRQSILRLLHRNKGLTVTDLYTELAVGQPLVSQQLSILRDAGLVQYERQGKYTRYFINYPELESVHHAALRMLETSEMLSGYAEAN